MKFAVAVHGTRGDVEPCAAVALELQRRGHQVGIGVPPDLVQFAEAAGLAVVTGYGVASEKQVESEVFRDWWKIRNPLAAVAEARDYMTDGWDEMSATLVSLSEGSDLIISGSTYQEVAFSVAEHRDLPFAALQYFPMRPNRFIAPIRVPGPLLRAGISVGEWAYWRLTKRAEDAQRRSLGLLPATRVSARRIVDRGTLEIQAYDEALFPGLDAEWKGTRPFVGSLTLGLETPTDDDLSEWLAAGTPPIYFGFGSTPIDSPVELLSMIESVCAELGMRSLVSSSGWKTFGPSAWQRYADSPSGELPHRFSALPRCRAPRWSRNACRRDSRRSANPCTLVGR